MTTLTGLNTVVWQPPQPGYPTPNLLFPPKFIVDCATFGVDPSQWLAPLNDMIVDVLVSCDQGGLYIENPSFSGAVLSATIAGGYAGVQYYIDFIAYSQSGNVKNFRVGMFILDGADEDISLLAAIVPSLTNAAWAAFFLSLPTVPSPGRLSLNAGIPQLSLGNAPPGTVIPFAEQVWIAFFLTLPQSVAAGLPGRLCLNNGMPEVVLGTLNPLVQVPPPESLWLTFLAGLGTTLPSTPTTIWLNGGRPCVS